MKIGDLHIVWITTTGARDGSSYLEWTTVVVVQTYLLICRECEDLCPVLDIWGRNKVPHVSFRPRMDLYGLCI